MFRVSLSVSEKAGLEQLRLNRGSNVGERAHYVLLCSQGYSPPQIAKRLERNIITIRLWLQRYSEEGLAGLYSRKPPGRPGIKRAQIDSSLGQLLANSPSTYGYQEAGWQINLLRDYFEKHGTHVCENTLSSALKRLGYVYKRFSKTLPKDTLSSSEKRAAVGKMVEQINQLEGKKIEVFFGDESHFSNQPYVSRGWFKQGEKNGQYGEKQA